MRAALLAVAPVLLDAAPALFTLAPAVLALAPALLSGCAGPAHHDTAVAKTAPMPALISHPIELIARAYGITI